jgi:hypothetical protein
LQVFKAIFYRGDEGMKKKADEIISENLKTIEELALSGLTEAEIASCLNIGYSTFRKVKKQNVALAAVLKKCASFKRNNLKSQINEVERSLFERAKGYDYETIQNIKVKSSGYDKNGKKWEKEEVKSVPTKVHVPADINAVKFFLVNAAKKKWQDNPNKIDIDKENLKLRKKELENKEW